MTNEQSPSWLERLSQALLREPQDREQLVNLLRDAEERDLLDAQALAMIEGVLQLSELQTRDIMIPRSQMVSVKEDEDLGEIFSTVIAAGHSRFPVLSSDKKEVIGILHAKDLLKYKDTHDDDFDLTDILRPAVLIPESKRLDALLQDFRINRNHMAIIVDEYGNIAGFATIEDVLEQIVGEIADEFDIDEEACIKKHSDTEYIIKAITPIDEINEYFKTDFSDDDFDTIGGLVTHALGHLPKPGEEVKINDYMFKVLHADKRRIRLLEATLIPEKALSSP